MRVDCGEFDLIGLGGCSSFSAGRLYSRAGIPLHCGGIRLAGGTGVWQMIDQADWSLGVKRAADGASFRDDGVGSPSGGECTYSFSKGRWVR